MPQAKPPGDWAPALDAMGDGERGVVPSARPDLFVIFLPDEESPRIERELAAAGMKVQGSAKNVLAQDIRDFVALVKCMDGAKLKSIVMGV